MKFACPVEASPFVADPRILIIFSFCFVSSFFLLHRVVLKGSWEVVSWPDIHPTKKNCNEENIKIYVGPIIGSLKKSRLLDLELLNLRKKWNLGMDS